MNVITAVAKEVKSQSSVTALARIDKFKLEKEVLRTGKVAVVIGAVGSWATEIHSAKFPRVAVRIYADPTRDVGGRKTVEDAEDRAMKVWTEIDRILHRTTKARVVWGGANGVAVLGSQRESEPSFIEHPSEDVALLNAIYNLKIE